MNKKSAFLFILICAFLSLAACGPSEEKIAQAQERYAQVVEAHNRAVEAHGNVTDDSLDKALSELGEASSNLESHDLNQMKDEEIDALLGEMDSLIASYEEYREKLLEIRRQEDAAVLTPIPVTLRNRASVSFRELRLYEEEDPLSHENVLEGMEPFASGESLEGLWIQRDVEKTPWVLSLTDTEGKEYEITLPVSGYEERGVCLLISYDGEQGTLTAKQEEGGKNEEDDAAGSDAEAADGQGASEG